MRELMITQPFEKESTPAHILILGVGNVLLTDEGIGIRAVLELARRYALPSEVELLDGGTSGIELLHHISSRPHCIIIDAMKNEQPPGTVMRVEHDDVPAAFRTRISPHQLGLSDLLAAAMLTGETPKRLVLFGIEPLSVDPGLDLSAPVEACLDRLLAAVVDELESLDVHPIPLSVDPAGKAGYFDNVCAGNRP